MARDAEIDVKRLLVDTENPRLPEQNLTQRDAMQRLAEHQGTKLVALAEHIEQHGLNPAQRFIVMQDPDRRDYIVLDGNRRLVAMKAVETPDAFATLPPARLRALKRLDARLMPRKVPCVIFTDREDAEPWIRLTHLDQRGGVGQSKWSSEQKARHEDRTGTAPVTLQILKFVQDNGALSAETQAMIDSGSFPMSMIERMLETKLAKPRLGLEIVDGHVATRFPREQVARGLTKFIDDVGTKQVDSRSLNTAKQRSDYLAKFTPDELPDPAMRGELAVPLSEAPSTTAVKAAVTRRARDRASTAKRPYLIPADLVLVIPPGRIHDIYLELKKVVRVDDATNAVGALLRMFLEMSLIVYVRDNKVPTKGKDYLRDHLNAVVLDLVANGSLTKKQGDAVRSAIIDSATGLTTLQAIVHNPEFPVTGIEMRRVWDRVQPLFVAMWS